MKDYQQRMTREYYDLYVKREKLAKIIRKAQLQELDFVLDTPIGILMTQCAVMDSYLCILKVRAELENFYPEFAMEVEKMHLNDNKK